MSGSSSTAFSNTGSSLNQPAIGGTGSGGPPPAVDDSLLWATPYVVSSDTDAPYQPGDVQAALDDIAASGDTRAVLLLEPGSYAGPYQWAPATAIDLTIAAIGAPGAGTSGTVGGTVEFTGGFTVTATNAAAAGGRLTFVSVRCALVGGNALTVTGGGAGPGAAPQVTLENCSVLGTARVEAGCFFTAQSSLLQGDAVSALLLIESTVVARDCSLQNNDGGVAAITVSANTSTAFLRLVDSTITCAQTGPQPVIRSLGAGGGLIDIRGRRTSATVVAGDRSVVGGSGNTPVRVSEGAHLENNSATATIQLSTLAPSVEISDASVINASTSGQAVYFQSGGGTLTITDSTVEGGEPDASPASVPTIQSDSAPSSLVVSDLTSTVGRYGFTFRNTEWTVEIAGSSAPPSKYVVDPTNAEAAFKSLAAALAAVTADAALAGSPSLFIIELAAGDYTEPAIVYTMPANVRLAITTFGDSFIGRLGQPGGSGAFARFASLVTVLGDSNNVLIMRGLDFSAGLTLGGATCPRFGITQCVMSPLTLTDDSGLAQGTFEGCQITDGNIVGAQGLRLLACNFYQGSGIASADIRQNANSGPLTVFAENCFFESDNVCLRFLQSPLPGQSVSGDRITISQCDFATLSTGVSGIVYRAGVDPGPDPSRLVLRDVQIALGDDSVGLQIDAPTPVILEAAGTQIAVGANGVGIDNASGFVQATLSQTSITVQDFASCVFIGGDSSVLRASETTLEAAVDGFAVRCVGASDVEVYLQNCFCRAEGSGSPVGGVIFSDGTTSVVIEGQYFSQEPAYESVFAEGDRPAIETLGTVRLTQAAIRQEASPASTVAVIATNGATVRESNLVANGTCLQASAVTAQGSEFLTDGDFPVIETDLCTLSTCNVTLIGQGAGVLCTGILTVQNTNVSTESSTVFAALLGSAVVVENAVLRAQQPCILAESLTARDCVCTTQGDSTTIEVTSGDTLLTNCAVTCNGAGGGSAVVAGQNLTARECAFANFSTASTLDVTLQADLMNCTVTADQNICVETGGNLTADNCYFVTDSDGTALDISGGCNLRHCRVQNESQPNAQAVIAGGGLRMQFTQCQSSSPLATCTAGGPVVIQNSIVRNNTAIAGPPALDLSSGGQVVRVQNSEMTGGDGTFTPGAAPTITSSGGGLNTLLWGDVTTFNAAAVTGFTYVGADFATVTGVSQTATSV